MAALTRDQAYVPSDGQYGSGTHRLIATLIARRIARQWRGGANRRPGAELRFEITCTMPVPVPVDQLKTKNYAIAARSTWPGANSTIISKSGAFMIYQAIYSSAATGGLTEAALTEILAVACERNAAADITGVPVATDGLFLQVLEGPQDAVTALLAKIGRDPRHRDVTIFHQSEQDARAFTDWRMAHLSPDTKDITRWAGQPGTATLADWRADVERKSGRLPAILGTIVEAL